MRFVHRVSMAAALLAGSFVAIVAAPIVSAQDATPAADCVASTPEENVAIVTAYITAYDNGDAAGIDETLHDEYADNIDRGSQPNDAASNEDEAQLAANLEAAYPGATYIINEIVAIGENRVLADLTISLTQVTDAASGEAVVLASEVQVDTITVATVECGVITQARTVSDGLALVLGLGFTLTPPEATPVP